MKKELVRVNSLVRWIAEHDRPRSGAAVMARQPSVRMVAAVANTTPEFVADHVVRVRKAKLVTGPANQDAALRFIVRYAGKNGKPPTYQEIADALALSTAATAFTIVGKLAAQGRVKLPVRQNKYRGIELVRGEPEIAITWTHAKMN
jgi:hypothetical protein